MSFESFIVSFGYLAIFFLILLNGILSFPSSQLIYVIAGYFASVGDLNIYLIILVGGLANTIGNWILYEIARRKGLEYSLKFFKFLHVIDPKTWIKKIEIAFEKRGYWFLFIGKLVNPIKIFIPIPAGITKMNRFFFVLIIFITTSLWSAIFTNLGFYFGKNLENFSWVGIIMLILFSSVIYYFYRYLNSDEVLKEVKHKRL